MVLAAELWAWKVGQTTAPNAILDGNVIVAAQVLIMDVPLSEIVVTASSVFPIARILAADQGQSITST
jgi:hypothetical protein